MGLCYRVFRLDYQINKGQIQPRLERIKEALIATLDTPIMTPLHEQLRGLQGSYGLLMRLFRRVVKWGAGEAKIVARWALTLGLSAA